MECGKLNEGSDTIFVVNDYTEIDKDTFEIIVDSGWKLLSIGREGDYAKMVFYTGITDKGIRLMHIKSEIDIDMFLTLLDAMANYTRHLTRRIFGLFKGD